MALTRKEILLVCLMEECDEVSQRASKALRFGLFEVEPGQELTNGVRIEHELSDLLAVADMLTNEVGGLPNSGGMLTRIDKKIEKVEKYLEYSKACGTLKD